MATTQVSKLLVRQGNFSDLPLLDPGELGYAKDQKRLFIGNDPIEITSTGASSYTIAVDVTLTGRWRVTTQTGTGTETELSSTGFTVSGTTLTLTSAPAVGVVIRVYYNTELQTRDEPITMTSVQLAASGSSADTGIEWTATDYNTATIEYSLSNPTNGTAPAFRNGKMTILIDTRAAVQDYYISDEFGAVNNPGVVFSGNYNTGTGLFKLQYTDSDGQIARFNYRTTLWNSTLA